MRPLRRLSAIAGHISVEALDSRMPEDPHSDPEIVKLTDVLNAMMERLEVAFAHANRFSTDVSHELKTPLTIMHGTLEQVIVREDATPYERESAATLLEEVQRLSSIVGQLSFLARADAGLITVSEVFADRTYQADGSLTPRRRTDALIREESVAVAQVIKAKKLFGGK